MHLQRCSTCTNKNTTNISIECDKIRTVEEYSIYINSMNLIFRIGAFVILSSLMACESQGDPSAPPVDAQGLFWFGEEYSDDEELPDHIDPKSVLCFGKGIKVGRCISSKLSEGRCLGLSKYKKKVIAIEVPCEVMSRDSLELLR